MLSIRMRLSRSVSAGVIVARRALAFFPAVSVSTRYRLDSRGQGHFGQREFLEEVGHVQKGV